MPTDILWNNFKGEMPKLDVRLRPPNYSQDCQNGDYRSGAMVAIAKSDNNVSLGSGTAWRTIYKMGSVWLYWTEDVDAVKAAVVPTAEKELTFYTGDGYPKQTDLDFMASAGTPDSTADYERLGVIAPTAPLTINFAGTGVGEAINTVAYQYTYVCFRNGIEHESAPSPATAAVDVQAGQYIYLTGFVAPNFASTGNSVDYYRVYRVAAGSTGAEYFLLSGRRNAYSASATADIAVGADSVYDNDDPSTPVALYNPLGEALATEGYDPPPDDMIGLTTFKNGMLVGFRGRELCVSETNAQYAWNEDNRIRFDYDIVSIGVFGGSIIVATEAYPYIVTGSEPGYLLADILPYEQACLSKKGLVSTRLGVIYPSPDGLFMVNDVSGVVLTKQLYTKAQWQALNPETIVSEFYDDRYMAFFKDTQTGIIVDLEGTDITPFDLLYGTYCTYIDAVEDKLHILCELSESYYIRTWAGGGAGDLSITYNTGIVRTDFDTNFPFFQVIGDQDGTFPCDFYVYLDGALLHNASLTDSVMYRLPADIRGKDWYCKVVTKATIQSIELISSRG